MVDAVVSPAKKWTSPNDIQALIKKRWESLKLLKAWLEGSLTFPYAVSLTKPKKGELSEHFAEVKDWIKTLHRGSCEYKKYSYEIQWQESHLRGLGKQRLPKNIIFENEAALFGFINKRNEFERFVTLCESTLTRWPQASMALGKHQLEALALSEQWYQVIAIIDYFEKHPKPGCYLRELSVPGVDSKFIEQNRHLVNDLLVSILPATYYESSVKGLAHHGFERRFGLCYPQLLVRFRLLDKALFQNGLSDLTVPLDQFQTLSFAVKKVYITENKINGLAFPDLPESMVIFGLGYGVQSLFDTDWLDTVEVVYWGDIDTHGFNILNQVRTRFPHTASLLMEESTLLACKAYWGKEQEQIRTSLTELTNDEQHVYQALLAHHWQLNLRLEQERIPYKWLLKALA